MVVIREILDNAVNIESRDYWFKIVDMLQQIWALVDRAQDAFSVTVFFVQDRSGVFDRLQFPSAAEAEQALLRNGFSRFSEDPRAQELLTAPAPPFWEAPHSNGPIYLSGCFWR